MARERALFRSFVFSCAKLSRSEGRNTDERRWIVNNVLIIVIVALSRIMRARKFFSLAHKFFPCTRELHPPRGPPRLIMRTTSRDFSRMQIFALSRREEVAGDGDGDGGGKGRIYMLARAKLRGTLAAQMNLSHFKNNVAARAREKLRLGARRFELSRAVSRRVYTIARYLSFLSWLSISKFDS